MGTIVKAISGPRSRFGRTQIAQKAGGGQGRDLGGGKISRKFHGLFFRKGVLSGLVIWGRTEFQVAGFRSQVAGSAGGENTDCTEGDGRHRGGETNVEHPTSNIQRPTEKRENTDSTEAAEKAQRGRNERPTSNVQRRMGRGRKDFQKVSRFVLSKRPPNSPYNRGEVRIWYRGLGGAHALS